jgi:capsular exopolysaccharide synthesis family protein
VSRLEADKNGPALPEPLPRAVVPGTRATPLAAWRGARTLPAQPTGTDSLALLKALARRWPMALVLGLILGGAGAAAAWFLLGAPYTAFAQVRVASTQQSIVFKNAEEGRSEFLTYLRTQARHLKSRFVLNTALTRPGVKDLPIVQRQADPLAWLEDELQVESQEGSEFITVKLAGPEPDELVALINAVIKAYEKEVVDAESDQRKTRLDEVENQFNLRSSELRQKKDSLKQMADDLGTSETLALTQKQMDQLRWLEELKKQHGQARKEIVEAQLRLDAYKAQAPKPPESPNLDIALNEALDADLEVKQQREKLERYQEIVAEYERRSPNVNDPVKKQAQREAERLQKKLAEKREKLRASLEEKTRTLTKATYEKAKSDYETLRPGLEKQLDVWTKEEARLRRELETLAKEAEKFGRSSTAFEMLKAEVKREGDFVDDLGKNRDILRLEQNRPSRVTIFQEAALAKHDMKRQLLSALFAAIAGLGLAGLGVSWLDCRARRIHSAEEVITGLGLRVVGAVPPSAPPVLRLAAAVEGQQLPDDHHFLESIDGIRTMLLRDARASGLRLILVTSAVSGEGKTTLASHLAGSLARAGRRTLLVDCDLRRPAAHQLFEVASHPGLSEVLLGEVPVAEAVRSTAVPGLWLLPAGQWDRAVLRALAGEEIQKVFAALRQHYDFIIIDSHPVLQAADSLLIGLHVDAVILALMRDLSRMPRVSTACQRLTDLGIPVLGAVVNGLAEDEAASGSYAYAAPAAAAR